MGSEDPVDLTLDNLDYDNPGWTGAGAAPGPNEGYSRKQFGKRWASLGRGLRRARTRSDPQRQGRQAPPTDVRPVALDLRRQDHPSCASDRHRSCGAAGRGVACRRRRMKADQRERFAKGLVDPLLIAVSPSSTDPGRPGSRGIEATKYVTHRPSPAPLLTSAPATCSRNAGSGSSPKRATTSS
jgi:hypothetical protein